ncbi:MAG TPA: metal ABC transporter permease [Acidimicrobiales bacterium]|nr:metal ABC transporter permease [Acidimicrobiales bacterium]
MTIVAGLLHHVFEPGFFSSEPVHVAVIVGGVVALVSAVVGVFTVIRGQSFAGHSLGDVGTTGGSGAFLVGANPLWGFAIFTILGAGIMELFAARRPRGRDLATGIVLGGALGIAALFLYLGTTETSTTGATITILFGSMFVIRASTIPVFVTLAMAALAIVGALYRPLLLSTVSSDVAAARGVPVRRVGILFLLAMAIAVSLSCVTIGAILSTALLIGPAAAALRLTKRPGLALAWAALIGLATTWLGILLAYDSFYWPPARRGWPVSFFVVALVFAVYLLADLASRRTRRHHRAAENPGGPDARSSGFEETVVGDSLFGAR